jgi:DNA-binding LacI/PurR family transcriptional regulator
MGIIKLQTFAALLISMKNNTSRAVTLRDVAALAGMDIATVSRALSGKGYVSKQKREAALKSAKELNFQPNLHARSLVQGRSHNVIALLPSNDLGVLTEQSFFIEHRLDELNYEVQIHSVPRFVSHFEDRQIALVNKVGRQRPGAIVTGSALVPKAVEELQFFMQEGGAVIGYGDKLDLECDQVIFDLKYRAYLATRHLLELGHREIGFCIHSPLYPDSVDIAGFSQAMKEFGAPINTDWIFGGGNYEEGGARLAQAYFSWAEKPTGLCIINDVSASAFVTAVVQNGVNVPDDLSVVGFDDAQAARYAFVPLTSASYPMDAITRNVVELTHSRLKGHDGPPRIIDVNSELVIRKSTTPYRPKSQSRRRIPVASPKASLL